MTLPRTILLSLVLLAGAFAGCATSDDGTPSAGKTNYIVGTEAAFAPFEDIGPDGGFVGFDIDVINEIAKRNNWTLDIRNLGFDTLIPSLQNGQIDMAISAMSITENRSKTVDFSLAYYEANQSIVQLTADVRSFDSLESMRGEKLRFGVQGATTAVDIVEAEFVNKDDGTIKRYDSYPLALQALKSGEVDVVMMDAPPQQKAADEDPLLKFAFEFSTGDTYGIAIQKGDTATLNAVNDALEAMIDDGTLADLKQKWGI